MSYSDADRLTRSDLLEQIRANSRQLMLSGKFAETCMAQATPSQLRLIDHLLYDECEVRRENKRNRLIKHAGFPALKTFDGYTPEQVDFPEGLTFDDIRDLSFVEEKMNLILFGPVGTGKTHMALAAGMEACERGMNVRFFTVAQLVRRLSDADQKGLLEKLLSELRRLDLLILDEWGFVPIDRRGADLLFQAVSESYETKSLIITTNLPFSRWGEVLTDEQMAAAVVDRLVHHGHMLIFSGESYRLRHALLRTGGGN